MYKYYYDRYKPGPNSVMSNYNPRGNLVARKAYNTNTLYQTQNNDINVNYNAPFFTTPASNYKQYPATKDNLVFANGQGQIFNVKDYNYAVVQPATGNPATVIVVNDPDVFVSRNDSWFLVR
jgi:hypothetical protein